MKFVKNSKKHANHQDLISNHKSVINQFGTRAPSGDKISALLLLFLLLSLLLIYLQNIQHQDILLSMLSSKTFSLSL